MAVKYNNRDYQFYVVVDNKIESGWEYREDAMDQIQNLPPNKKGKVVTKSGLRRFDLNPDDNADWWSGEMESVESVLNDAHRM